MVDADITIRDLAKVGPESAAYLISHIGSVKDFPKPGILFRDFLPVLADAKALTILLDALEAALPVPTSDFDVIAGLEARGFLFGPALAARLGKGFIAVRKAGKLPTATYRQSYELEYGTETVEIERDALAPGQRVLIVDDLIATGGSALAAAGLVEQAGAKVVGYSFVMGLEGLPGFDRLAGTPTSTLVTMPA